MTHITGQGLYASLNKMYYFRSMQTRPERTKQMESILNFQVPAEGLELVNLLLTYTVLSFEA